MGPQSTQLPKHFEDEDGTRTAGRADSPSTLLLAPYGPALLLFLVGIMSFRTWEEVFFIGSVPFLPQTDSNAQQVFFFAKAATLLACALLSGKARALQALKWTYGTAAILLAASTACKLVVAADPSHMGAFALAASLLGGIGIGIVMMLWFGLCGRLAPTLTIACYLTSIVAAPLIMVFCYNIPLPWLAAVGLLLSVSSVVAIAAGFKALPREAVRAQASERRPFWKIVVLMAVFGFSFAFREPLLGNTLFASGSYTAVGSIGIASILLIGIALRGSSFNIALAFRIALPLTAVAFLLLPTDIPITRAVSDTCSAASCKLVEIFAVLILSTLCYRYRMSTTRLFGLAFGAHYLFVFLGRYAWVLFGLFGVSEAGITVCFSIVAAGAIALAMLLLPDKDSLEAWGLVTSNESSGSESNGKELAHRCHDFAKEFGLTLREEEIVLLLAQDKTNSEIQETLFISKETVKTHRRNLYAKCNVHSRDELVDLLEGTR